MKNKKGCYVLMLAYVDDDWMDIGGNIYPPEGYVESKKFTRDIDIRYGLYGIPWGKTCNLSYEQIKKGHWVVVKTEQSDDVIKTDSYYNRYKFRNGCVVYSDNLRSAAKYIIKNKNGKDFIEDGKWIQPEEIAGTIEWIKEYGVGVG